MKSNFMLAALFWVDKETETQIGKEYLTERLNEDELEPLGLLNRERYFNGCYLENQEQVDYLSQFIKVKIELDKYDYFLEELVPPEYCKENKNK